MDPTTISTLLTVAGMIAGYLIRHYIGGSSSPTPATPTPAAPVTISGAGIANAALHPLLSALTAQFDAAIQQVAANFANQTLAVTPTVAPGTNPAIPAASAAAGS